MPAFASPTPLAAGSDEELDDARASLAYWEDRLRRLPLHAVRRRREAREMAARWEARVAEAERDAYGRGLLGALLLLVAEGRLPAATRRTGRTVARRSRQAAVVVLTAVVALLLAGAIAAVEVLVEIVRVLS
jgi:hypothetical protein